MKWVKIFLMNFNVSISADNVIWGKTDRIQARKIIGNHTFWLPLLPYPASIYNVIWVMFNHKFLHSSDIFWRFHNFWAVLLAAQKFPKECRNLWLIKTSLKYSYSTAIWFTKEFFFTYLNSHSKESLNKIFKAAFKNIFLGIQINDVMITTLQTRHVCLITKQI